MAKWGEGDPRWIVEQRADSHNVNNWHWKEIDSSEWSKKFLKEALCNIVLDDGKTGRINITEVSTIEGDATCSIRKQKFIFIFDWEKIVLKWSGNVSGLTSDFTGTIKIMNFDHDADDDDDLDFEYKFSKDGPPEHSQLKAMLKKMAPKLIWSAFSIYKDCCGKHFSERLALAKTSESVDKININENNQKKVESTITINNNVIKPRAEIKTSTGIDLDKVAPVASLTKKGAGSPNRVANRALQKCKSTDLPKPKVIEKAGLSRTASSNTEPTKQNQGSNPASKSNSTRTSTTNLNKANLTPKSSLGSKILTKKITMTDKFKCAVPDVYSCFVDVNKIRVWSQNSLSYEHSNNLSESMEFQKGTKFDLFSKNVSGVVTKVTPNKSVELQWRLQQWPESHFSNVIINFDQKEDGTQVSLEQTLVPTEFVSGTTEGWRRYYFSAIKQSFGMGMGFMD